MIKFDLNTYIYRPLNQVFAFVTTPENDFHWQYGTLMSTKISKGEIGIGTLFRSVDHFMGRRMESVYEVTEFEPDKRYGFRSVSGPIDLHTIYTFEVMNGSTRINISTQIGTGTRLQPTEAATEKKIKKQSRENLALLKEVLETSHADRPSGEIPVSYRRRSDFR